MCARYHTVLGAPILSSKEAASAAAAELVLHFSVISRCAPQIYGPQLVPAKETTTAPNATEIVEFNGQQAAAAVALCAPLPDSA